MPTLAVNKITCLLAACLIHAAGATPPATAQTTISNAGNCTIVLERSSARDVKVSGCNQNPKLQRSLEVKINAIIANQAVEIDRIDDIILSLNDFFKISESNQKTVIEISYSTNDKVDKILDILESFQEKPEDAAAIIPLLSDGNLSHLQKKKPFGIQIVNVIRVDRGTNIDLVIRVVESGPQSYQIGVLRV
jgi:Flp pilus assembly secretin CpaC